MAKWMPIDNGGKVIITQIGEIILQGKVYNESGQWYWKLSAHTTSCYTVWTDIACGTCSSCIHAMRDTERRIAAYSLEHTNDPHSTVRV